MISLFLSIIIAAFTVYFYDKKIKREKILEKTEDNIRKVYFEQGDRQITYRIEIFSSVGKTEFRMFSVKKYDFLEEVFSNCDAAVWGEKEILLNMPKEQIYFPWTAIYQVRMVRDEVKK